jgi:hypothetical protein
MRACARCMTGVEDVWITHTGQVLWVEERRQRASELLAAPLARRGFIHRLATRGRLYTGSALLPRIVRPGR